MGNIHTFKQLYTNSPHVFIEKWCWFLDSITNFSLFGGLNFFDPLIKPYHFEALDSSC